MEILNPFLETKVPIKVAAEISVHGSRIDFHFEILDPNRLVLEGLVPGLSGPQEIMRADNLWKTTCLEAFWAVPGEQKYWELNISPGGKKWNCYRFENYRQPVLPVVCYDYEIQNISVAAGTLECSVLGKSVLPGIEASLCVIVRTANGTHFFSTAHAGSKPDFHNRGSFTVRRAPK